MKPNNRRGWHHFMLILMKRFGLFTRADRAFLLMVPTVGLATGVISVAITLVMRAVRGALWGEERLILQGALAASWQQRLLIPLAGGVAIAILFLIARSPLRATGIGTLIEAVALRGGYLATVKTALSQVVAIFTVSFGGSAGREGPLTVSGATFASKAGRALGLRGNPLKILVGCGTAAGMAAAYNAPIGGAIFAMEVVLGNFALDIFGPIVISSVIATVISRAYLFPDGNSVYVFDGLVTGAAWELPLFALLGIVAGALAVLFIQSMEWGETAFEKMPVPAALKPVIGFAMIGAIGVFCPYVYGNGYETVDLALNRNPLAMGMGMLLLLPLLKLLATSITIGCGGAGGLFTPSLFVGSLVGYLFGVAANSLLPEGLSAPSVYALIGMGAIAAATTQAPISTIFIIFECTQHRYSVILPLMAACIVSSVVSRTVKKHSIFTGRMARRGVELPHRLEELVMETMTAKDIFREDRLCLRPKETIPIIFDKFMETRRNHLYVIDKDKTFLGAVSLHDLKQVLMQSQEMGFMLSIDVLHPDFPYVLLDDRLTTVMQALAKQDFERIPVLENAASRKFAGYITKRDLMAVYNQEVLKRPTLLAKFKSDRDEGDETTFVELPPRYRVAQITVGKDLGGKTLAELNLPADYQTHVLELKRYDDNLQEFRVIPDGSTRLTVGDRMIVLGLSAQIDRLREAED